MNQTTPKVELLKIRDLGETITDSFTFLRQNLKPLLTCFFIFCGFFLAAEIVLAVIQQSKVVNQVNNFNFFTNRMNSTDENPFAFFGIEYFLSIIFILLNYTALPVIVYSYMTIYKEKGNEPATPQEVWGYFKFFYLKVLGSSILISLLIVVGVILCIIPGIYLYPIMALIFPVMICENTTFGYAFNRSFKLIKDNWWTTFGTMFIMILIVYFAVTAILLPLTLLNFSGFFLHPAKGMHLSQSVTIITTVLQHLCQVFYILPLTAVGLCYYNLTEKLDSPGLMERLNRLGNTEPDNTLPGEGY